MDPPFDRNFISKSLNIFEDSSSKKVPLLYSLLFGLKKEIYEPNTNGIRQSSNIYINSNNKEPNLSLKNDQPQPWIID